jgi:HAD superfamily hydrolase (TIGR01509 family)
LDHGVRQLKVPKDLRNGLCAEVGYRAWLVDLDGTLYGALPVKLAMALELLLFGLGDLKAVRAFRCEHEALRRLGGAFEPSPFREQLRRAALKSGIDEAALERIVATWMQKRPCKWIRRFQNRALIAELRAFRANGGKLALVSDYPGTLKLEAMGLQDCFDVVVCNGEPGGPTRLKPAPDGYLLAAERLGCEPAGCLVIGDRDDADGAAARAGGMGFRKV